MTPFTLFALLYMAAIFLELAEKWTYPLFTLAALLLAIGILSTRITRVTFLIFLAVTTSHFLLVQFPEVPNHVNIIIYSNTVMMVGIVFSLIRIRDYPTDDDYFAMIRPLFQVTAILVYFLAGFHKLNAGFVNPEVTCVQNMVSNLSAMATTGIGGIPVGAILMAAVLAVVFRLLSPRLGRRTRAVVRIGAAALVVGAAAIVVLRPTPGIPPAATTLVIMMMVVVVILWELIGGPLLFFSGVQLPLLAFSWTMHSTLALIGFVDFAAFALSLLFTFVPRSYLNLLNDRLRVPFLGFSMHRAHLYFAINVLSGIASGLQHRLIAGIVFNVAALVFIWPLLAALTGPAPRLTWGGVALSTRMTPRWMFLFPVILLLHGMTSYLGLRTTGNFSMFSNLRTEGPTSNHFLLRSNPLKLWSYQEDVVSFIDIDDRRARIGFQYQLLDQNQLPVVEFRKLIYAWTRAGRTIPMTIEYDGKIHSTEDIVNDPVWRTEARDWEMVLLDFRSIQPDGPNRCRW